MSIGVMIGIAILVVIIVVVGILIAKKNPSTADIVSSAVDSVRDDISGKKNKKP